MAKFTPSRPIYSLTPTQELELREQAQMSPVMDADLMPFTEDPTGRFLLGMRNSLVGTAGFKIGMSLADTFGGSGYSPVLNLTKRRSEADPLKDDPTIFTGNDPESIAKDLEGVPYDEWPWILSSGDWQTYQRRKTLVKTGLPEAQSMASPWGTAAGIGGDMAAMVSLGILAEPVALAGLGARTGSMAGRAASYALGEGRTLRIAEAATEAANTVGRFSLTARYTALGMGEETVYQMARYGMDPVYEPTGEQLAFSYALSGGLSGLLGGAAFGRSFVKDQVIEGVVALRRSRVTELPGGYKITYGRGYVFDSPAAADQMLFAPGTGSFVADADQIADDLFVDWNRIAGPKADFFIPGTREVSLPVLDEAAARQITGIYDIGDDLLPAPAVPQQAAKSVPVTEARPWRAEVRAAAEQIPAKPEMGKVVGLRSAIKAAAFELNLAGMPMTKELFSKVAQALVRVERLRVRWRAFNKAFWEEVSKDLPPEVVAKLRSPSERTFIPGIDRSVMDLSQREDMVDAVWNNIRDGMHLDRSKEVPTLSAEAGGSLIFRVLHEIRQRGGTVSRNTVANVIDELRVVSQNPPKVKGKGGRTTIDMNARRAQVLNIINKRVAAGGEISIPNSVLRRMNPPSAVPTQMVRGVSRGPGEPVGTQGTLADASDTPRNNIRIPFLSQFFNQSAFLHESDNGWARLVGNMAMFARRSFDKAQGYTVMEEGSKMLATVSGMFVKGYNTAFIRFALGGGQDNVTRQIGLSDGLIATFKDGKLRREFHARVAKQLRSGAYDDGVDAVNDAARAIRDIFNKVHDFAAAAGLQGFTRAATTNYFPRMWRWDRIRMLSTTAQGKQTLVSLIRQAIDQNGRRVIINGVEEAFENDIDEAALAFSERLIAIAKGTENAPLVQQEQELFDAIAALEGPLKAKTGSKTPYGRSRLILDETASVGSSGDLLGNGRSGLSIADLTNDDLPFVMRKYLASVIGAANEKKLLNAFNEQLVARGIKTPAFMSKMGLTNEEVQVDGIDQMIGMIKKLGGALDPKHEASMREIIAALRYEPIHHGRTAMTDRIGGILYPMGYLAQGGQFALAQMGEISRIVGTLGFQNTLKQMPILQEMLRNWKNPGSDFRNFSAAIDQWWAPSTDRLRRTMNRIFEDYQTDEYGGFISRGMEAAARKIGATADLMSDISLLAPMQSFTQNLTAAATIQHMWEASRGLTKYLDDATVRTLGFEPEEYARLVKWVGDNAVTEARFLGDRVVDFKSVDSVEMMHLGRLVDRMVRTRIQDIPTRGDFAKGMFSFMGRMLTQFRTFNLKGVDNFLLQNASRVVNGGPGAKTRVFSEVAATMVFAGAIQWSRNAADWYSYKASNDFENMEEIEKKMTLAGFARGALTGPSEFFLPMMLTDTVSTKLIDRDPLFSPYRYSGLSLYGVPAAAYAMRAGSVVKDVYGATVGKALGLDIERDITQGTIHKARLLLPFQTMIGLKQYFNILEQQIVDEYDLPKTQPRNRDVF